MNKLMKKIKKLENDTISKQLTLEQVTPCFQNDGCKTKTRIQKKSTYFVLGLTSFLSL